MCLEDPDLIYRTCHMNAPSTNTSTRNYQSRQSKKLMSIIEFTRYHKLKCSISNPFATPTNARL